eukprot:298433-Rhodomonas_salina.1
MHARESERGERERERGEERCRMKQDRRLREDAKKSATKQTSGEKFARGEVVWSGAVRKTGEKVVEEEREERAGRVQERSSSQFGDKIENAPREERKHDQGGRGGRKGGRRREQRRRRCGGRKRWRDGEGRDLGKVEGSERRATRE